MNGITDPGWIGSGSILEGIPITAIPSMCLHTIVTDDFTQNHGRVGASGEVESDPDVRTVVIKTRIELQTADLNSIRTPRAPKIEFTLLEKTVVHICGREGGPFLLENPTHRLWHSRADDRPGG